MNRQSEPAFKHEENLIARCTHVERSANLAARTFFVQIRTGAIQREVDQLYLLAR